MHLCNTKIKIETVTQLLEFHARSDYQTHTRSDHQTDDRSSV